MAVRRYGFVAGLGALVLALDQITKVWVLGALSAARPTIEVTSFLNIVLVWNRGISFGLFNRESDWQPWLLVGLSLVIVAGLLLWLRTERGRWMTLAIALLAGGAIGNAVDRVRLGAVVDFLDFHVRG
ncbi:MAG: signal peptidase II, partial [Rhodospirillaceae bacterium]|nr:signal peptidase II [Rhodospirillaceae bacterium]